MIANHDVLSPSFWTDNNLNPLGFYVGPGSAAKYFPQSFFGISVRAMAVCHDSDWEDAKKLPTVGERWHAYYISATTAKDNTFKILKANGLNLEVAVACAEMIYLAVRGFISRAIYAVEDDAF